MTRRWLAAVGLLFAATFALAQYQGPGGGGRGDKSRIPPGKTREDPTNPRLRGVPDPMIAIERELPSLATDLNLAPEQKGLWRAFERSVRDVAELSRQRTKKLTAERPLDAPAPAAAAILSALADDDRIRSEAMVDVMTCLKAVQETMTPTQRSMFDRRVHLALSEPLGMQ
ncbi:Spy/CpxP family protein refolding chaperone [Usitatibacter palustris]|uniref:LTXXQ motif family protein n=1 Tax=Usitatibacter palustris TaxID=2732487 RepID=A0A6M4H659_9PROT|nr:Spy/CpxP family protein refolding chaperone [Usitatibacter palustris]QJR14143.1 hypothetical protein DSM104440_00936 [Usitatibacter palustris]